MNYGLFRYPFAVKAAIQAGTFAGNVAVRDFITVLLILMIFTVFPVLFTVGPDTLVLAIFAIIVIVPVIVFFVWVGLYYKSMWYDLREDEMSWKHGIWSRTTGITV
jgi:membrane protein YdbS with pleckstrin-like domain